MRVCVIGARGGIGRHVVDQVLAAGHEVTVLVRAADRAPRSGDVRVVVGELTDADSVAGALDGCAAVIWAVGATSNTPDQPDLFEAAARTLVMAMERQGVRRLIALSGAGVTVAGERKPLGGRLVSRLVALVVPHVVEAKRREYEVFSRSSLEWTLVRPPRVVEGGPTTAGYRASDRLAGQRVTQGDLATFMADQLVDERWWRSAPFVSSG